MKVKKEFVICFILIALLSQPADCALTTHLREYAVYNATSDEGVANVIGARGYYLLKWQSKNYSAINNDPSKMAEIIFEQKTEDQRLLRENEEWELGSNYSLKMVSIDLVEKKARMQLLHNGTVLKDSLVGGTAALPNQSTFVYKRAIAGLPDVPQFVCYLYDVFHGLDASVAVIKYAFLISEQTISLPVTIPVLKTSPKLYAAYEASGRDEGVAGAIGAKEYYYLKWQSIDYAAVGGDPGRLAKIIVNQSIADEKFISEGEAWTLGEGYSLRVASIDSGKKLAWLQLYCDEVMLKEEIKGGSAPADRLFVYKKDIAGTGNVPQFLCYLGDILQTANKSYAAIKYAFLISDETAAMLSSEIKINPLQITTGQRVKITINLTSEGEPVAGARILLNTSGGELEKVEGLTDSNGSFTTWYGSSAAGNFNLSAVMGKAGYITTSDQASVSVSTAFPDTLNTVAIVLFVIIVIAMLLWFNRKLRLSSIPVEIPADGISTVRMVIECTNSFGSRKNVKSDMEIKLSTTGGTLPGTIVMSAGSSMVEVALIASKEVGIVEVAAAAGELKARTKVAFVAPELHLKLGAEPGELPADGKSTAAITIGIEDKDGNPFTRDRELTVQLNATLGTVGSPVKIARNSATANATLIAPVERGVAKITASVENLSASTEVVFK